MDIQFVDLKRQYDAIKGEIDSAISGVISKSAFIGGQYVRQFEDDFAAFQGTGHCVSCANGTDAIEIALKALGVGQGDEVIVPALSWISTSETVRAVGARPVFVDVHPEYYTIDVGKIAEKITDRTRVIMPVHLYGLAADMDAILLLAEKHHLAVIEDCAQAHGALFKGRKTGTMGTVGTFSFYPGKNLGAYGDAGAVVTSDENLARQMKMIANHGQLKKHTHVVDGRNSRLDGLQAAILSVKLRYLEEWNSSRRKNAQTYDRLLAGSGIPLPSAPAHCRHVYHLYVVQLENRDLAEMRLGDKGIGCAVHYPCALPFLDVYQGLQLKEKDFPAVSRITGKILSLPMFAELTEREIDAVAEVLKSL